MNHIAIILGANGQDGYYLTRLLRMKGLNVLGVSRNGGDIQGDAGNHDFLQALIKTHKPSYVFHLAAVSSTDHLFWEQHQNTITDGVVYLLEAIRQHSPASKVFISGSALQFKNSGIPINEQTPFEARDFYSVSRIHSTYAARYYRTLGIKAYVGYFFNHDSPLRSPKHLSQKIVAALKNIIAGSHELITIGDLEAKKEWGFAGDIVEGINTLINQDEIFEAVLGTGKAYSVEEWLNFCFSIKNLDWKQYVMKDPTYTSPYNILVSQPDLMKSIGWEAKVSIEELAQMMINNTGYGT